MHIIMGGTVHVGAGVASTLLAHGEAVVLVVRNAGRAQTWRKRGAQIIEADVAHPDQLRNAFRGAWRAFLCRTTADRSSVPAGLSEIVATVSCGDFCFAK
ncbi:MAG: hypothetical protein EOO22_07395 [Comamonadaceae bacterium]|nr:MAG: hypothetical protein EOO22_07395 [Comamonadaceae bacterium]